MMVRDMKLSKIPPAKHPGIGRVWMAVMRRMKDVLPKPDAFISIIKRQPK